MLDRLRAKALNHLASREVRYTVSLDPDVIAKLDILREGIERTVLTAGTRPLGEMSTRRTIADTLSASEQAVDDLEREIATVLAQAKADDSLVIVRFGLPAPAKENPAAYYESICAPYDEQGGRGKHDDEIRRALVVASYIATESPDGDDLGFDWATVSSKLLGHADLDNLDRVVLDLYRSTSSIPFDPVNYSQPPQS
jgi:hypothetical protein